MSPELLIIIIIMIIIIMIIIIMIIMIMNRPFPRSLVPLFQSES